MSAYLVPVSLELQKHLATAPLDKLLMRPTINLDAKEDQSAYPISKMGNIYRVQAAARKYSSKGARLNTISPGVVRIGTALKEMEDAVGGVWMKRLVSESGAGRIGTPEDIANAADYLTGPQSSCSMF
jgi:NAD(P)-dependent dehydrogenase (short-subunit alcohol dehydrogenase family)